MSSSKRWADVSSSDEEDERPVLDPVVKTEEPILAKQDAPVKRERASFSHPRMPRQNEPAAPIFQRQTSDSYPARPARSTGSNRGGGGYNKTTDWRQEARQASKILTPDERLTDLQSSAAGDLWMAKRRQMQEMAQEQHRKVDQEHKSKLEEESRLKRKTQLAGLKAAMQSIKAENNAEPETPATAAMALEVAAEQAQSHHSHLYGAPTSPRSQPSTRNRSFSNRSIGSAGSSATSPNKGRSKITASEPRLPQTTDFKPLSPVSPVKILTNPNKTSAPTSKEPPPMPTATSLGRMVEQGRKPDQPSTKPEENKDSCDEKLDVTVQIVTSNGETITQHHQIGDHEDDDDEATVDREGDDDSESETDEHYADRETHTTVTASSAHLDARGRGGGRRRTERGTGGRARGRRGRGQERKPSRGEDDQRRPRRQHSEGGRGGRISPRPHKQAENGNAATHHPEVAALQSKYSTSVDNEEDGGEWQTPKQHARKQKQQQQSTFDNRRNSTSETGRGRGGRKGGSSNRGRGRGRAPEKD